MSRAGEGLLPAQADAATAPGSVAVVAGAGTGKTHMLAHRFLHHLEQGLDPLEIVAVTFTERAAAQLRARIRTLVAGAFPDRPDVPVALEAAQISTLHALAARICRDHPEAADVPPDFSVLDELEGQVWLADRLEEALAELPAVVFDDLPYALLREALRALLADPVEAEAALACAPEAWGELVAEARESALRDLTGAPAWREAAAAVRACRGSEGDKAEAARTAAVRGLDLLALGDVGGLASVGGVDLRGGRKDAWAAGDLAAVKGALKALREAARAAEKEGLVALELGDADERLAGLLEHLRVAFRTVQGALAEDKRRRRVLDFADLEVHALRALERREVREHYASRWRAVLVDEFQDTNPVQERLLELLSVGMTVSVVGDEKQSIYGFRGADVEVFRRYRRRLLEEGGSEIVLDQSFRAHEALALTVNRAFAQVLGAEHQELRAVRTEAPHAPPHVSAHLVSGKDGRPRRQVSEARLIARVLRELLDAGTPVFDEPSRRLRPLRPGDIAVLARTWQPLGVYGEVLPALGVPAVHTGGGNLLDTREAKDAMALLRVLADPRDDVALVAVLRGPFFAIDDVTLYRFSRDLPVVEDERTRRPGTAYAAWWQVLHDRDDLPETMSAALRVLDELSSARAWPPSRRLALADRLTGYTAVLGGLPGAQRRLADWTGTIELVRTLEQGMADTFSVVRRLRRLLGAGVEVPRPTLQADDAVSLLTIHRSKGLEWPVVVVADLDRTPNGALPRVLFGRGSGVALRLQDDEGETVEPALYTLLKHERRRRAEQEARRVLYVALTRARDRLLLTAAGERGGALDTMAPGLEAAGVECERVDHDAATATFPAPPPPADEGGGLEPVTLERAALGPYARHVLPRRPASGVAAPPPHGEDDWELALTTLAAFEEAWLPLARALRAAGAAAPDPNLIDVDLTRGGRVVGARGALGWRGGRRPIVLVDVATPDEAYDVDVVPLDPSRDADELAAVVLDALAGPPRTP